MRGKNPGRDVGGGACGLVVRYSGCGNMVVSYRYVTQVCETRFGVDGDVDVSGRGYGGKEGVVKVFEEVFRLHGRVLG